MFTHCTTRDLLALRQSCHAACDLLERSEKVGAAASLAGDFARALRQGTRVYSLLLRMPAYLTCATCCLQVWVAKLRESFGLGLKVGGRLGGWVGALGESSCTASCVLLVPS